jgi:hypothetical protein
MPEATINEDRDMGLLEDDVRTRTKTGDFQELMLAEPQTLPMQSTAQFELGFGVDTTIGLHPATHAIRSRPRHAIARHRP